VLTIDPAADQPRWLICRPRRTPTGDLGGLVHEYAEVA
jgi:hypothetical protein